MQTAAMWALLQFATSRCILLKLPYPVRHPEIERVASDMNSSSPGLGSSWLRCCHGRRIVRNGEAAGPNASKAGFLDDLCADAICGFTDELKAALTREFLNDVIW